MKKEVSILTEPKTFQFKKYGKEYKLISLYKEDSKTIVECEDKSGELFKKSFKTANPIKVLIRTY